MKTFFALAEYGLMTQLSSVRKGEEKPLLRWEEDTAGPTLTTIFSSKLTVIERIGIAFGSRELSLEKICEIAQRALSSVHNVPISQAFLRAIKVSVRTLDQKIDVYNDTHQEKQLSHICVPDCAFISDNRRVYLPFPVCGIANTGNKCYCISTLLALYSSEEVKMKISSVYHPSDVNLKLQQVFYKLGIPGSSCFSLLQEPFLGLMEELKKVFEIRLPGETGFNAAFGQQDAHEWLLPLLEAVLGRTDLIHFREIVSRCPIQDKQQRQLIPEHLIIPSIDCKAIARKEAAISTGNVLSVEIPKLKEHIFPLQAIFEGVPGMEDVEVEAILQHEENKGKISDELAHSLREEGQKREGKLDPIPVIRSLMLAGEPPPFLTLHLLRFKTKPRVSISGRVVGYIREKILTRVQVPFRLRVPVIGGPDQEYILRGSVLHLGASLRSGHYVTCIPNPLSPLDSSEIPTVWKYYNDGKPVETRSWETLSDAVSQNGYLFFYDRIPSSS
jgi:ubiquitin C-terminal hydrolase